MTTSHSHTISLTNIKNIRELLGGLSFERIIERLSKRKKIHLHAKISEIEDVMLQEIMEKRGIPNQSQIIREAIRVYFALLHGVKEFAVGNIIIKNPILNLNIAEAKAEASAEVDIELLKRELNIYKRRLKLCEEELKLQEKDTELQRKPLKRKLRSSGWFRSRMLHIGARRTLLSLLVRAMLVAKREERLRKQL